MDELIKWSSLAMPLVLGVSTLIAVLVYRFTQKAARLQALNLLHSRWHEVNRVLIDRPAVQRLLGDPRFVDKSDDEIIVYNLAFQIVNTCYELHVAGKNGLVEPAVVADAIAGSLMVFRGRPDLLQDILKWNPGFEPGFKVRVTDALAKRPAWRLSREVPGGNPPTHVKRFLARSVGRVRFPLRDRSRSRGSTDRPTTNML
jgi:hypothetical protein